MLVSKWHLFKKAFDLEDLDAPDDPDYLYNLDKLNDLQLARIRMRLKFFKI